MAAKVRTRAMPGKRYGIDDANGMRLFTARLVEVGARDDPQAIYSNKTNTAIYKPA